MRSAPEFLTLAVACTLCACASAKPAAVVSAPAPVEQAPTPVVPAPVAAVVRDTVTVADPEAARRLTRLELRLLEKEAQVDELQARLDETRGEFVRTLARLQTATSRAEAASGMAEADVALQSFKSGAGAQQPAAVAQVTKLVQEGSAEFSKNNYGGALYLATQAKMLAASYRGRAADARASAARPGETAFALPITLRATSRANVRDGPGTTFGVVFSVDAGSTVTGRSYLDEWIRITDETGRTGWIFRNLVVKR